MMGRVAPHNLLRQWTLSRPNRLTEKRCALRCREVHQPMKTIERAARALCKFDGHAENIRFEGEPMWRSYVPQARALLDSVRATPPAGTDIEVWRMMIDAALAEGDGL